MQSSMRPYALFFAVFACTLGRATMALAVIDALANAAPGEFAAGGGLGPAFCAVGSLLGALALPWLNQRIPLRPLAWLTLLATYGVAAVLWALAGTSSAPLLVSIAGLACCAANIVLSYCIGMSVYSVDEAARRKAVAQHISLPFLLAEAIGPFAAGWLLGNFGLQAIALLVAVAYLVSASLVQGRPKTSPGPQWQGQSMAWRTRNPAVTALVMAFVIAFGMSWYFSSTLSFLSGQNVSPMLVGSAMSAIQGTAILAAALAPSLSAAPGDQRHHLVASAMVLFPMLLILHGFSEPHVGLSTLSGLLLAGSIAGVATALTTAIKFNAVAEHQFAYYQSRLSVLTLVGTLGGAFAGSSAVNMLGWQASLLACAALCLMIGLWHFTGTTPPLKGTEVFHGSIQ